MPNQFNGQRPIDKISQENYSWWKKSFVFIKKTEIKTWQAIFIIAFAAGAITAIIWTVNNNLQSVSDAAVVAPPTTGTVATWPTKTTGLMAKLSSGANVSAIFSTGPGKIEIDCAVKVTNGYNNIRVFNCPTLGSNQVCTPAAGGTAVTVRVFDTLAIKSQKVCGGGVYVVYR